jgi:hypothetical protein
LIAASFCSAVSSAVGCSSFFSSTTAVSGFASATFSPSFLFLFFFFFFDSLSAGVSAGFYSEADVVPVLPPKSASSSSISRFFYSFLESGF